MVQCLRLIQISLDSLLADFTVQNQGFTSLLIITPAIAVLVLSFEQPCQLIWCYQDVSLWLLGLDAGDRLPSCI